MYCTYGEPMRIIYVYIYIHQKHICIRIDTLILCTYV